MTMKVAVIAFQGDVSEHVRITEKAMRELGIEGEVAEVRRKKGLEDADAVILPGGESTTISKRLKESGMDVILKQMAAEGKAVMGTCAGCILLAKEGDEEVERTDTELLGIMDMKVRRNAFGRQRESFETELDIRGMGRVRAVFIRGPAIVRTWGECRPIARFDGKIVGAIQGSIMALAFHPELGGDTGIHRKFIEMAVK